MTQVYLRDLSKEDSEEIEKLMHYFGVKTATAGVKCAISHFLDLTETVEKLRQDVSRLERKKREIVDCANEITLFEQKLATSKKALTKILKSV